MIHMKKKKIISILVLLFLIISIGAYKIIFKHDIKKSNEPVDKVVEQTKEEVVVDYNQVINDLKKEYYNNDIVGILEIENSDYVVPILQGDDNEYYLNHDAYGNSTYMGAIYLDYRVDINNSKKLLIYGHNSQTIDMPFKILENYYNVDYYKEHKYIDITTNKEKRVYEVFSVYVEAKDFNYMNVLFNNEDEYNNHLKELKSKSMYETETDIESEDDLLILQTCSTHKDYIGYNKKYLLISLKRIK